MKRILNLAFFLSVLFFTGCNSLDKINILDSRFKLGIGIFFLTDDTVSKTELQKIIKKNLPGFQQVDSIPDSIKTDNFSIESRDSSLLAIPDIELLNHYGKNLSDEEKHALQKNTASYILFFGGINDVTFKKQQLIAEVISGVSANRKIILCDLNNFEWFNPESWRVNRIDNFTDLTKQITIDVYRESGFCRAVTLGMDKFGLPDICINNIACSNNNSYVSLINSVIQTLFENPFLDADSTLLVDLNKIQNSQVRKMLTHDLGKNAKKSTKIKLSSVTPQGGDNNTRQFEIIFRDKTISPQELQQRAITELFGSDDAMKRINHDSLLLEKSRQAKERLPELKSLFDRGLDPGYSILVKAPFKIDAGGNEWMWVEITKWSDPITGVLQNDAFEIENLKAGAIVQIKEAEIFDYILYKPDGTYEGNETGKIIEQMNSTGN